MVSVDFESISQLMVSIIIIISHYLWQTTSIPGAEMKKLR